MNDKYSVIYINIDGFARYYFDIYESIKKKKLFLKEIANEGVFFNNLRNVLPSITNPCQNMILSGSTSKITGNVYRYYDKTKNIVIQQKRENKVKLISELAVLKNLKVVSIAHFLTEKDLTKDDYKKLYIKNDDLTKDYNYEKRFEQLFKVLNKEPIKVDDKKIIVSDYPDLMILYMDDLDGLGHNFTSIYGSNQANNEHERIMNVLNTIEGIDNKIKRMIEILRENNYYDNTIIFITTDHGMTPYGAVFSEINDKYSYSKLSELISALRSFDSKLEIEFLSPNEAAKPDTNLVLVGANLNIQLSFLKNINDDYLNNLKEHLLRYDFIGKVKTKKELETIDKYLVDAADMFISPSERYYFSKNSDSKVAVRGQHDSMLDSSNHIIGAIFGGNTKKLGIYEPLTYNYDLGRTIGYLLGLDMDYANGKILKDLFSEEK